jgi:hypothetical protein
VDEPNPKQYRDVDDAQALKAVSYIVTPVGMALEWCVMRPLHYLATKTAMAPLLSGDKDSPFFTNTDNAKHVPPGTFAPPVMNRTYDLQASSKNITPAPAASTKSTPAESSAPSKALSSGGQPALH